MRKNYEWIRRDPVPLLKSYEGKDNSISPNAFPIDAIGRKLCIYTLHDPPEVVRFFIMSYISIHHINADYYIKVGR